MAYDPGAIDATLAAAVGDDPVLVQELRLAFRNSATHALGAMRLAETTQQWRDAALRLRSVSASFGALRLMGLADIAAGSVLGDALSLKRIAAAIDRL